MKNTKFIVICIAVAAVSILCATRAGWRGRHKENHFVEWVTMGTVAEFHVRSEEDLGKAHIVMEVFADIERLVNAHDKESELSRLSNLDDNALLASASELVRPCYEAAFKMRDVSGGVFNPRWRGEGMLDLGAIAKGYAVDLAAERVGPCDALISLGGNMKALGGEWRVGVMAADGRENFTLQANEACATSGEYFRGNHIKNALTGKDVESGIYSVSVRHPSSAMLADALSTVLFILGREKGDAFLNAHFPEASAIWVRKS